MLDPALVREELARRDESVLASVTRVAAEQDYESLVVRLMNKLNQANVRDVARQKGLL